MDVNNTKDGKFIEDIKQIKTKRHALVTSSKPFSDKDFPADIGIEAFNDYSIHWKRIKDLDIEPHLYQEGCPTKGDMEQGLIEDRPLVAVLSAIANHPKLMNYIFPLGQDFNDPNYCGLFYFRFWKMGKWVYIIVDDKVPVVGNKKVDEPKKKDRSKGRDLPNGESSKTISAPDSSRVISTAIDNSKVMSGQSSQSPVIDAERRTSQQQNEKIKETEKGPEEKKESIKSSGTQLPPQTEGRGKQSEDNKSSVNPQPPKDEGKISLPESIPAASVTIDAKPNPVNQEDETRKSEGTTVTATETPKNTVDQSPNKTPETKSPEPEGKKGTSQSSLVTFGKKAEDVKPEDRKPSPDHTEQTKPQEPPDETKVPDSLEPKQSSKRISETNGKTSMGSRGSNKNKEIEVDSEKIFNRSNSTIFVRVFGSEGKVYYWATLLEKACAKAYGGYNQLPNISVTETLLDLTGGVTEIFYTSHIPRGFFLDFKNYSDTRAIILAATNLPIKQEEEAEPKGDPRTDLFAVTSVILADFRKSLGRDKIVGFVRLLNPYGEVKWMDPWKETSQEWQVLPPLVTTKLKMESRGPEEFYLTYKNFLRAFTAFAICTVPDGENFNSEGYIGEWIKPKIQYNLCRIDDLRFHEFPQHKIWVRDPNAKDTDADVVLSLVQNGRCCCSETPFYNIMQIFLFCLDMERSHTLPLNFEFFRYNRPIGCSNVSSGKEVTARFKISQGHYLVVPVIDCSKIFHPCQANDYVLRVITPAKFPKPPPPPLSTFTDSENLNIYFDLAETIEEPKNVIDDLSKLSANQDTEKAGHKEKGKGKKKRVKH